ncbi:HNH endonuclease [Nocardioides terrae]|uniref:HNH endonuclease n=1 Tax=Nocardioides terrae TaxID=574651 RepID=A0A1I1DTI3_9ACTN|nr:HNH endonuclease signature motif containing protein [Nocardioides terrae]SFB77732.1 HNH endonuclease [Nocardioides terrae]
MSISVLASPPGEPGDSSLDASGDVLAALRASRQREAAEQVLQARLALDYCAFNSPDSRHPAATVPGTEGELALAGEGAPGVAEFAVVEFGAAAGMSTDAARLHLGRVLELGHRLRQTWRRVRAGQVPVWRALRIADLTQCLPPEGAAWVDTQVAPVAGRVGPRVLERLVEEAIVRFDPETAARTALEALETRHATVTVEQHLSDLGAAALSTGRVDAVLDVADALDLDTILAELAAELAAAGDTDPLDVRRAKALGLLARGEAVDLPHGVTPRRRRAVVLHVHLAEAALRGYGDGIGELTTDTGHRLGLVTVEQVQEWCGTTGATVTVKPVLDLAETLTSTGYQPSTRLRDQVVAAHVGCAFPHCHRPADNLDLDHIVEHAQGGPTTSDNLAPLCRRHHRAKTFGHWTYLRLGPAEYLWTSPHGYQWVKDTDGTRDVSPDLRNTG